MNLFNILKNKVNITEVVSKYLTLKRIGSYLKGQCPFHSEKTPSFTISPEKGIFYCFGCHVGGDAVAFIAKIENCSQFEAAKMLARDYNIDLPESTFEIENAHNEKENYVHICQLFETWCHQSLLKSKRPLDYLFSRGLNFETIKLFKIGYFPNDSNSFKDFLNFMSKNNILINDLLLSKLLYFNKEGYYCTFEQRIIFSIKDNLGRILGFGGRTFEENDSRPKYYNSHDNQYFKKGHLLFGLDIAKKSIQEKGYAFLVEGYLDAIMMIQSGFKNTIATLGTACTQGHISQIAQYADKLYITYDSDKAGQNAILRMVELCWYTNLELYVIKLPSKYDPALFLQEKNDFEILIEKADDIFNFLLKNYGENFKSKSLSEKIESTKKVIEIITKIKDNIKRHLLLKKASELFEIPLETLKNESASSSVPTRNGLINKTIPTQVEIKKNK